MLLFPLRRHDPWRWPSLRELDEDLQHLIDIFWRSASSAHCDENGVLTLTPTYRYCRTIEHIDLEVEIPGVQRDGVAVEVQGDRLRIIAAKYSPDRRSSMCARARARARERAKIRHDSKNEDFKQGNNYLRNVPSLVYKLHLRLSSRADLDAISATCTGDGVLRISVPIKDQPARKIVVKVSG